MNSFKIKVCDSVEDETGIKLSPNDVTIESDDEILTIKIFDTEILNVSIDGDDLKDDAFQEDVITDLFEEYYDLREKLVEVKIGQLNNQYLPEIKEYVVNGLQKNKVLPKIIEVLDFEFLEAEEFGAKTEDGWGYPAMSFRITDFEGLEYIYYFDLDVLKLPFDMELITKEFMKKIR